MVLFGLIVVLLPVNLYISSVLADNVTPFPCRSNLAYDFGNIDRFTDNMCAQCLWYMAGSEAPWQRFDQVNQWNVIYNHNDSVNVLLCKSDGCSPFGYDDLKSSEKNSIANEFKSTYYLVLFDILFFLKQ